MKKSIMIKVAAVFVFAVGITLVVLDFLDQKVNAEITESNIEGVYCLDVRAPYGYGIVEFRVRPTHKFDREDGMGRLQIVSGGTSPNEQFVRVKLSLYEFQFVSDSHTHIRSFPDSGALDIPLERPVKFTDNPRWGFEPGSDTEFYSEGLKRQVRKYCGTYVLVTKNKRIMNDMFFGKMLANRNRPKNMNAPFIFYLVTRVDHQEAF